MTTHLPIPAMCPHCDNCEVEKVGSVGPQGEMHWLYCRGCQWESEHLPGPWPEGEGEQGN